MGRGVGSPQVLGDDESHTWWCWEAMRRQGSSRPTCMYQACAPAPTAPSPALGAIFKAGFLKCVCSSDWKAESFGGRAAMSSSAQRLLLSWCLEVTPRSAQGWRLGRKPALCPRIMLSPSPHYLEVPHFLEDSERQTVPGRTNVMKQGRFRCQFHP